MELKDLIKGNDKECKNRVQDNEKERKDRFSKLRMTSRRCLKELAMYHFTKVALDRQGGGGDKRQRT